ncbi:MAG: hypothetical protein ABJB01_09215 [Rudaea sp.]
MARFIRHSAADRARKIEPKTVAKSGVTLAQLKEAALRNGCTPAQFLRAVESAGEDPVKVERYLKRNAFIPDNLIISGN